MREEHSAMSGPSGDAAPLLDATTRAWFVKALHRSRAELLESQRRTGGLRPWRIHIVLGDEHFSFDLATPGGRIEPAAFTQRRALSFVVDLAPETLRRILTRETDFGAAHALGLVDVDPTPRPEGPDVLGALGGFHLPVASTVAGRRPALSDASGASRGAA